MRGNSGFQFDSADYLAAENLLKAGEKVSEPGDVLFTSKGTVGRVAFVSEKTPRFVYSPQLTWWRVKDTKRIEPRFLYYWMHGREFCVQINSLRGQTDMADYVSLRDQRQMMHVTLPSLDEQKAIAHILGTLDDKIELNQQMNHTLESIARALFKSWFIDFDPVRAKMDGRQPAGMDAETAALFPEEFEDSPLGKIPRGWKVQTLSDLSEISSGKRPSERSSELTAEMPIQLFGGGGVMAYVKAPLYQEPILLTGRVGALGLVFRISSPCWASDNTLVVVPKENWNYEFLYFQLKEIRFESLNRGSTQPLVTQGDLKKQKFVVPHIRLLQEFHRRTSLLYKRLEVNIVETESLTSIRDALLPKLLSGEIRIKDPEKVVEQELSIVTG